MAVFKDYYISVNGQMLFCGVQRVREGASAAAPETLTGVRGVHRTFTPPPSGWTHGTLKVSSSLCRTFWAMMLSWLVPSHDAKLAGPLP